MKEKYLNSKRFQYVIGTFLALIFFASFFLWLGLMEASRIYLLCFPIVMSITQFATTPISRASGLYQYQSPMLLVYNANDKVYDLHSGTTFDYLLHMKWADRGLVAQRKMLAYFIEGLLNIITKIEKGEIPETVKVVGTSYFFSERTAKKWGFKMAKPSAAYRLNLIMNGLDLFLLYSYAQNRWVFPKIWEAKKMEALGSDLVANKTYLEGLYNRLS